MVVPGAVWVLVLITNGGGTLDTSLHFTSQATCETAAQNFANTSVFAYSLCVKAKGLTSPLHGESQAR
jgi:hypothetical protein